MVYVLSKDGKPLMPTTRHGKVRRMLNEGKAKVVRSEPLTIQLTYEQKYPMPEDNVVLGLDAHRNKIGISVVHQYHSELFAAEVIPRQDVRANVKKSNQLRQSRRRRNTNRKRKPNRYKHTKFKHLFNNAHDAAYIHEVAYLVKRLTKILPITHIIIESGEIRKKSFYHPYDKKYMNLPNEESVDKYNNKISSLRHKILTRDRHTCQCCFGKSKDPILVVRHLDKYDKTNNIMTNHYVTLCKKCDKNFNYLKSESKDDMKQRRKFMNLRNRIILNNTYYLKDKIMRYGKLRPNLFDKLKRWYESFNIPEDNIQCTYGYHTKYLRRKYNVEYSPINNARLITGDDYHKIVPLDRHYAIRYRKHHNRSLHKITPKKGGERPRRSPKVVHGFQSYDVVKCYHKKHPEFWGKRFFITKKRKNGYFAIGRADGTTILNSVKYDCLQLIRRTGTYSIELV